MRFFRGGKRVSTSWKYHSDAAIWRIYPTGSLWILGEERDTGQKRAKFFCLDRLTGKVAWSRSLLDDWWVGVEAVTEGSIVIHGFATPDMPMHKGITVVELPTGSVRWERPDLSFEAVGVNSIIGSLGSHGKKRYATMDLGDGRVLQEWNEEDSPVSREALSGPSLPSVTFPVTTLNSDPTVPSEIHSILRGQGGSIPVSWIRTGSFMVVSFQDPVAENRVVQVLSVRRTEDGEEVFSDNIATEMFVPDSFLVQDDMLYYVRARTDLVAVNLESVTRRELT